MKPVVFIHSNAVQAIAARVAAWSLKARSKRPDAFEVRIIWLEETPHLSRREGQRYIFGDRRLVWRNRDANSHGPLRMIVPQLMEYRGRALDLDPDIFAVGDVSELLERDMKNRAVVCRARPRRFGRPPSYYSSVMLLDCEKLKHWKWDQQIDEIFLGKLDSKSWMMLQTEDPASIGHLEEKWNDRDKLSKETGLIHNTEPVTQPWKTGLPVDYDLNQTEPRPIAPWHLVTRARTSIRRLLPIPPRRRLYRRHPDPRQERYFFSLLRECLKHGGITEEMLHAEIQNGYLRPDAFDVLHSLDASS